MPVKGVDVYHGDNPVDFHGMALDGVQFVIAKSSQGIGAADPSYQDFRARIATVPGVLFGAYHFFLPDDDPVAQARHFLASASPKAGEIVPFLDVETAGEGVGGKAYACAAEIQRQTGYWPGVYSGDSFFGQYLADYFARDQFARWIARYGREPENAYDIWQDSESGRHMGTAHDLDTDVYPGALADFKANLLLS